MIDFWGAEAPLGRLMWHVGILLLASLPCPEAPKYPHRVFRDSILGIEILGFGRYLALDAWTLRVGKRAGMDQQALTGLGPALVHRTAEDWFPNRTAVDCGIKAIDAAPGNIARSCFQLQRVKILQLLEQTAFFRGPATLLWRSLRAPNKCYAGS